MATIATSASTKNATPSIDWGRYARVGLGTIVAAILANVLVYYLGGALVAYDPQFPPLANVSGAVIFTVVPAIVAVLLYAILLRFARRPARTFAIVAAAVLALSIVPDFTSAPTLPGATGGQIAILILMHVVAAALITATLTRLARP